MFDALPRISLADLEPGAGLLVLCASSRLAQEIRRAHAVRQAPGQVWQALAVATPAQWLDHLTSSALLRGEIPPEAMPGFFLGRTQELLLWQQAIATELEAREAGGEVAGSLFDLPSLARLAREADALMQTWNLAVPDSWPDEEYQAYRRWRAAVAERRQQSGWLSEAEAMAWRIGCIGRGVTGLPARVALAGFATPDPMLRRLLNRLEERGVGITVLEFGNAVPASAAPVACRDVHAECRAAAAWARAQLERDPGARLRIAVTDLAGRREHLAAALDAALHPEAYGPLSTGLERRWALAVADPIEGHTVVDVALRLLRMAAHPHQVRQEAIGALLREPGWSADLDEADARARFEAWLRERLPPETSLARMERQLLRSGYLEELPQLAAALAALTTRLVEKPVRCTPGIWGRRFLDLLQASGWPGQRTPIADELAAIRGLHRLCHELGRHDEVAGRMGVGDALRLLEEECRRHRADAGRERPAGVEICTLEEAVGAPADGLWIMGMNEGEWPPAPQPNPLLPAEIQRRAGVTAASVAGLAEYARQLQDMLVCSANEVIVSWAEADGDHRLRPVAWALGLGPTGTIPDVSMADVPRAAMEAVEDVMAPPLAEGESVRGGTWLLRAQAICPAWAFYQYRLRAAALPAPTFGLDPRTRGSLLHSALEELWRGRCQADLASMDIAERTRTIEIAVTAALDTHDAEAPEPLPVRFRSLEQERLVRLLQRWLPLELKRPPFRVTGVESQHELNIEGLPVRVVVDRVDELEDGRGVVIIDYKSGRSASADSWADGRISEPQLPIYAALVFPQQEVAAVALARVTLDGPGFVGIAAADDVLPEVKALDRQRRRYPEEDFPDWRTLRSHWATAVRAIALEVRAGRAEVRFSDESDLLYCDVLPLLRLEERRSQWEES